MRVTAIVFCTLLASAAMAGEPAIGGYAGLAFGDSHDKALELFPRLEEMGGGSVDGLAIYKVSDQSFESLKHCAATLSFIGDRFYEVKLDCGGGAEIERALEEKYGAPTEIQEKHKVWKRDGRSVTMNLQSRGFGIFDDHLAKATQQYIMQRALSGQLPVVRTKR